MKLAALGCLLLVSSPAWAGDRNVTPVLEIRDEAGTLTIVASATAEEPLLLRGTLAIERVGQAGRAVTRQTSERMVGADAGVVFATVTLSSGAGDRANVHFFLEHEGAIVAETRRTVGGI